ncbi:MULTISPECIES: hypothetical protein [Enterobacter cloacae complex]|uniref:hypothetical protein n=1 Tax=Enterobacter cloacae complex TaxID=354276 RepID=UPI00100EC02E|nr:MULTISPECIES: hypothetical protein [Enterobacter cloacae complex]RYA49991.1 hypothetical protein DD597_15480 [Enterobacter cloacae complex sp. 677-3DZ2D5B]RYA64793.1 hypothetical protein DD599_11430 [Enterobacter cloacae complex sp. CH23B]RYA71749.1 hypothetical protein DD598_06810 [Enterobacter cloacae complex sp. 2DZ2F16B1]
MTSVRILGGFISDAAKDGIYIGGKGVKVEIENTEIRNTGRSGVHVSENDTEFLFPHGLNPETPKELLLQAREELKANEATGSQDEATIFSKIGLSDWIEKGANLTVIADFLMNTFK